MRFRNLNIFNANTNIININIPDFDSSIMKIYLNLIQRNTLLTTMRGYIKFRNLNLDLAIMFEIINL